MAVWGNRKKKGQTRELLVGKHSQNDLQQTADLRLAKIHF